MEKTHKSSVAMAGLSYISKAVQMEKAQGLSLRLGCPSESYMDQQVRKAQAATMTGGKGFMKYSEKIKVGSLRGNKRRADKARLFHGPHVKINDLGHVI